MNTTSSAPNSSQLFGIEQHRAFSLRLRAGTRVSCITGQVWLTQEGMAEDIVLSGGNSMVLQEKGLVVMTALGHAAALVHVAGNHSAPVGDSVIFTPDFVAAVEIRARALRRTELARLGNVAREFWARAVRHAIALAKRHLSMRWHLRSKRRIRYAVRMP